MAATNNPYSITANAMANFSNHWLLCLMSVGLLAGITWLFGNQLRTLSVFVYNCFLRPLGVHATQQTRLNAFYKDQAQVYDTTRHGLLRGRRTMLKLCATELCQYADNANSNGLVWVDIGGGTGWNIEQMDAYLDLRRFRRIYLVDLCQPLCQVAEQRFKARGWSNICVVCQDAASFELSASEKADLVTMSYSLSMIENCYRAIDRAAELLVPDTGVLGVADFYISDARAPPEKCSTSGYRCSWLTRVFWQHWFELDHVYLHPARRNYLEHKLDTVKEFNGRNHFIVPYLVQIPYYIWLGRRRSNSESLASNVANPNCACNVQPGDLLNEGRMPVRDLKPLRGWIRHSYNPASPEHAQFSTYIYGFTWEDPQTDIDVLDLQPGDNLLVITSAGDNALAYATHTQGITIHCVDMNPYQNHMLELKLAALRALDYQRFWLMFGEGQLPGFGHVLDTELSAHLSSSAYQYWRAHTDTFDSDSYTNSFAARFSLGKRNLYTTGYSGFALQCLKAITWLLGIHTSLQQITTTKSVNKQVKIWRTRVVRQLLENFCVRLLDNPAATWQLMGVPTNQLQMLRSEGSMSQYVRDTLDPVFTSTKLSCDNYFYRLLICQQYTQDCCPDYLTTSGYHKLREVACSRKHVAFHIHTATIVDTLWALQPGELTKCVLMDHMDWLSPADVDMEIAALKHALQSGGFVLWRSAARSPWYAANFAQQGFRVDAIAVRRPNTLDPLDRVNMYASFYKATMP